MSTYSAIATTIPSPRFFPTEPISPGPRAGMRRRHWNGAAPMACNFRPKGEMRRIAPHMRNWRASKRDARSDRVQASQSSRHWRDRLLRRVSFPHTNRSCIFAVERYLDHGAHCRLIAGHSKNAYGFSFFRQPFAHLRLAHLLSPGLHHPCCFTTTR